MAKGTISDITKEKELKEPTRPAAHKLVKDVGMVRGESAKPESPAYKAGVELEEKAKREAERIQRKNVK